MQMSLQYPTPFQQFHEHSVQYFLTCTRRSLGVRAAGADSNKIVSGCTTSPLPVMISDAVSSATPAVLQVCAACDRYASLSPAHGGFDQMALMHFQFTFKQFERVKASAVPPAKPAMTLSLYRGGPFSRCLSLRYCPTWPDHHSDDHMAVTAYAYYSCHELTLGYEYRVQTPYKSTGHNAIIMGGILRVSTPGGEPNAVCMTAIFNRLRVLSAFSLPFTGPRPHDSSHCWW